MANGRDDYVLDLIKIFNWDETDIGIDKDTFCTYVPSCQSEISVTVSDFLSMFSLFQCVFLMNVDLLDGTFSHTG